MKHPIPIRMLAAGISLLLGGAASQAGTFNSDFNSGIPWDITLLGNAADYDHSSGGVNNSGVLKITTATASQQGTAVVEDLDAGQVVAGFEVEFDLFIGGGNGADGFSFVFGDFPDWTTFGEEGPSNIEGLTISFDSYNNGGSPAEAPAIDLKWNNVVMAHRRVGAASTTTGAQPIGSANTVRNQTTTGGAAVYWPVKVRVETDGRLHLAYNNVVIFTNVPIFRPITEVTRGSAARFAFGARTGGSHDNHWVDNLRITTYPLDAKSGQPYVTALQPQPVGANASAVGGVFVELKDAIYQVRQDSIQMLYNNTAVTPTVIMEGDLTRISYRGASGTLPSGVGTVTLRYSTTSTPPVENDFSFRFAVDPFVTIPASYKVTGVDRSAPGFKTRVYAMDATETIRAPGNNRNRLVLAERELAAGYTNPETGQPYANMADMTGAGNDGYFAVPGVINWNFEAPNAIGNFSVNSNPSRPDEPIPGIPSLSGTPTDNFSVEILTLVELKAGGYRFGFNSDDGFRASFGPGWDAAGTPIVGFFNDGRGASDTLFDVVISEDGVYPLRVSYWQGTGGANAELFMLDVATNRKILLNDLEETVAPRTFRGATGSRPSISRVLPVQNWPGAAADEDLIIDLTDGGIVLDPSTVQVLINNQPQTVTLNKSGGVTTVRRASSLSNLLPSGRNDVTLIYGFTEGGAAVTLTNNYSFFVAPYYGVLPPANRVPAGQVSGSGFNARVHQIDRSLNANQGDGDRFPGEGNRMPRIEVHLAQGYLNPTNGMPYPNLAQPGSGPGGSHEFELFNFNVNTAGAAPNSGMIQSGQPPFPLPGAQPEAVMPGLPGTGTSQSGIDNYAMEAITYLDLKRGVYIFGINSDDGFLVTSAPNAKDTLGTLVGFFNGGRGNSGDLVNPTLPVAPTPGSNTGGTTFSVIVQEDGIYPFRILFWQGGGGVNAEFYVLNKLNGHLVLINDVLTVPWGVRAYSTYTGPERAWVQFSVSPTPWDNRLQQAGPGPIQFYGRTANSVDAVDIYNNADTDRPWADVAVGAVLANAASTNVRLLINGEEVTPTVETSGTSKTVSYRPSPPLPSGSTNTASLVYEGVTNSWTFRVQTYANIPASVALPLSAADPQFAGFRAKVVQAASGQPNTAARAENQLAGTPASVAIPGPGPDGTYIIPGIINWNSNMNQGGNNVPVGNFQNNALAGWPFPKYADDPIPGVPGTGLTGAAGRENIAAEIFGYLKFDRAGYYRFGANGDDGWKVQVGAPGQTDGTILFTIDRGAGAADIPFSFTVPEPGLYPIRLVWYQGGGGGNIEYFSYDDAGNKIPINDPNNPNAIKAYYSVGTISEITITSATVTDGNIIIQWTGGGAIESASNVLGPWTSTGNSSGTFTEAVAPGSRFYRVR
jgi:hypothetical protein